MLLQKAPSHLRTLADCHMIGLLHMYHSVCLAGKQDDAGIHRNHSIIVLCRNFLFIS